MHLLTKRSAWGRLQSGKLTDFFFFLWILCEITLPEICWVKQENSWLSLTVKMSQPSAIMPQFSETRSQSGSWRQTQWQCLKPDLKPPFLIRLINQLKTVLFCYARRSNCASPFGFFFVPKMVFTFFITQLEGLRTDGVTKVPLVKSSKATTFVILGCKYKLFVVMLSRFCPPAPW